MVINTRSRIGVPDRKGKIARVMLGFVMLVTLTGVVIAGGRE